MHKPNLGSGAYLNLIMDAGGAVRGHGNAPNKKKGAGPEQTTQFVVSNQDDKALREDRLRSAVRVEQEQARASNYVDMINAFPTSDEKRVVSYGLYGQNPITFLISRPIETLPVIFKGNVKNENYIRKA